ncbi:unannotated protein [freshwater metagenome]|uniref:Unannotated protein n=1 Tax=freshwater metagenome TaxID=449393 RepID=A0A6J6ZEQ5_9ZZZZ
MTAPVDSPHLPGGTHVSPLWYSHHHEEQYDRCVQIGKRHVCRRCVVLYPLVLVSTAALMALGVSIGPILVLGMWILPLPMTLDWIGEYLGQVRYSPSRQVLLTALAAPALGCAFALHLQHAFSPVALAPMTLYVLLCCAALLWRSRKARAVRGFESTSEPAQAAPLGTQVEPPEWEQAFLSEEAERTAALHALLK